MSEQIDCGEGWRWLRPEEYIQSGDEVWGLVTQSWFHLPTLIGEIAGQVYDVRRRVPSKPEAMEIDHQTIKCNSFDEVMQSDDSGEVWRLVSSAEQARQLADWLKRYADWREAQDTTNTEEQ